MAALNVFRQGSAAGAQVVNFTFTGTATIGTDYTVTIPAGVTGSISGANGTVTIPAGVASVAIDVSAVPDVALEPDETIIVTITGSTPSVSVLPNAGVCLFVLKNDDFQPVIKWLAVSTAGTMLIGLLANTGTPWVTANTGPVPPNWNSWNVGVVTTTASVNSAYGNPVLAAADLAQLRSNPAANFVLPALIKAVIRTPLTAHTNTTDRFNVFNTVPVNALHVLWRTNATGTWDLEIGGTTVPGGALVYPSLPLGSWHDLILAIDALSITAYLNGGGGISGTFAPTNFGEIILRASKGAVAAFAYNRDQVYNSSLFPITSFNL